MKETIWKFKLEKKGRQSQVIEMPLDAEILTVQTQDGIPCIWALVDPTEPVEKRFIEVFGTGCDILWEMGMERKYLGSYRGGFLLFHVFEITYE